MERVLTWCLGFYSLGAFAVWLLVGELTHHWHDGVVAGSTIALLSLGAAQAAAALDGKFGRAFPVTLALSSIPIGFLAQTNHGGAFRVFFWTAFWILMAAVVVGCLRWLSRKVNKDWSY